jgi:Xaa-Pro aminopeptidase
MDGVAGLSPAKQRLSLASTASKDSAMDQQESECRLEYQGDTVMARLLAKAGSPYELPALRELIAGVLAAPPCDEWPQLVAATISRALRAQLIALRGEMAKAAPSDVPDPAARLALLRAELARNGVSGFLVPRADEHQGEYVPLHAQRLAWLTGFTGSAGLAIVLADRAAVFVDGRYTLQVRAEVDGGLYEYRHISEQPASEWIAAHLGNGALGYDPWLHTAGEIERFGAAAAKAGGRLQPLAANPLDAVWADQPPPPLAPVVPHDLRYAGKPAAEKRSELAASLAASGVDAAVLTAPDSIAWLLNIRGGDVSHTPLPLSFAILKGDATVELFIDRRKLMPDLATHLGNGVTLHGPGDLAAALAGFGGKTVQLDPATAPVALATLLTEAGATLHRAADPCVLPKSRKNETELAGTRAAHRRDGAALTRFLAWLAREAPSGKIAEIAASDRLEEFRREGELIRDLSFPTISGAGANGAIVHYRAAPKTEKLLLPGTLYLVDSGAQYLDGTTDVTRTVAIGTPPAEAADRFTRVLKGHIALATCRFPVGTTGSQLDALARNALWQAGLDFDHGTGHGVGSYLGVHEGPQRISKLPNPQALLPGMIVSNEPGYYKTGEYGIRIENLVVVVPCDIPGAEREMLCFETLTLAPIDRALVVTALLSAEEIAWLDAYHRRVRDTLTPLVDRETAEFLATATAPLAG